MKKAIEFFYKGPGAIILIAAVVISLGIWMRQKQDRKEARKPSRKRSASSARLILKQRPLRMLCRRK